MKLFVGVDASQKNNQCCIIDQNGNRLVELNVANNFSGAQKMEAFLDQKASELNAEELKVATEASSLYDFHILEFLSESQVSAKHNLRLYRFNPRLVKAFNPIKQRSIEPNLTIYLCRD